MNNDTVGFVFIGVGIIMVIGGVIQYMNSRLNSYIEQIIQAGQAEIEAMSREVSELTLRDKGGDLFSVKIIIDHNLDPDMPPEELQSLMGSGEAGRISDLSTGETINPAVGEVKEFIFSSKAIEGMRQAGLEPDTVVVNMLRASGKIA